MAGVQKVSSCKRCLRVFTRYKTLLCVKEWADVCRGAHHRHERVRQLELGEPVEDRLPPLGVLPRHQFTPGLVDQPQLGRVLFQPRQRLPLLRRTGGVPTEAKEMQKRRIEIWCCGVGNKQTKKGYSSSSSCCCYCRCCCCCCCSCLAWQKSRYVYRVSTQKTTKNTRTHSKHETNKRIHGNNEPTFERASFYDSGRTF